jgi:hypothetical protein
MDTMKDATYKDQAIALFATGIDVIFQLKSSVDGDIALEILGDVFWIFSNILNSNYVTKKYFQDKKDSFKMFEGFSKKMIRGLIRMKQ